MFDRVSRVNNLLRDAQRSTADARAELNDLVAQMGFVVAGHPLSETGTLQAIRTPELDANGHRPQEASYTPNEQM